MKTPDSGTLTRSMLAMRELVQSGLIIGFVVDLADHPPTVTVTITAQDELTRARVRRAVTQALEPSYRRAKVIIRQAEAAKSEV